MPDRTEALPGFNLIFHSIRRGGGMETHVLDLLNYASAGGIPACVLARRIEWPEAPPANVEWRRVADRTPFSRLNNALFERGALQRRRPEWPTIAISRCPGAEMCVVGGTHLGHLADRGITAPGFFDRQTIARESAMYAQARQIIAHSGRVAGEIERLYGIDPARIMTLYPPVDTRRFSLDARRERDRVRAEIGLRPDEFLLLFPSNNHALKGGDLILDTLRGFAPRVRLAVAGKAPLAGDGVINLGFRNDMPALYAAADAVILASRYEAFGLVGPEAILCGTPVLFADTIGAVEVLSPTACRRFERTTASLAAALGECVREFSAGRPPLSDPDREILYPYSPKRHFDTLFARLAEIRTA